MEANHLQTSPLFRVVCIQKVDLDTALTALLLGVRQGHEVRAVAGEAEAALLSNPEVACIECGGSGQTALNNWDHHNIDTPLPSAARQAWTQLLARCDEVDAAHQPFHDHLNRLVDYVDLLDTCGPQALRARSKLTKGAFPTLSHLFSGMLMTHPSPVDQLFRGMDILRTVLIEQIDPFGTMPRLHQWANYITAKQCSRDELESGCGKVRLFTTRGGRKAGFLESGQVGASRLLSERGCEVRVLYCPAFGPERLPKYTISSDTVHVAHLLSALDRLEKGWGGPSSGTLIASPRETGSRLKPSDVVALVTEEL